MKLFTNMRTTDSLSDNESYLYAELNRLVEAGGTGLLATHDTSIGMLESDHPDVIINKCFEIDIDGEFIKFDYKIQDGITQKMNAVFLMKQMGFLD
jgi:DNA mismatch repair ATPase MutS